MRGCSKTRGSLEEASLNMFGVAASRSDRHLLVLDKSFLQGVSTVELQHYVQDGWVFAIPDVLWHEHFRKWDEWRLANLIKLKSIEPTLVLLPGLGEMLRAESEKLKPASQILAGKRIKLNEKLVPGLKFFELDENTKQTAAGRTAELEERLDVMIDVWRDFKAIPDLQNARTEELPEKILGLKLQIRDDRTDIRGFYANHRDSIHPPPEMIDEEWTFYRLIQVYLLAGLDFFASYGLKNEVRRETAMNELLDLDYLIFALLVGGLACRETRFVERFRFLRPDGIVLR